MKLTVYTRASGNASATAAAISTFVASGDHYSELIPDVFSQIPRKHWVTAVHLDRDER